jgi:HSP20 family protein
MAFLRWEPLREVQAEMNRLRGEMDRLFGRFGNGASESSVAFPAIDMWEDEERCYIEAELPGLRLEDLEIYVTGDNQLSIKGQRQRPQVDQGTWHRQERGFGSFVRVIPLPVPVDSEQVEAEFVHGVLTIRLTKREEVKPRRIEVKAG